MKLFISILTFSIVLLNSICYTQSNKLHIYDSLKTYHYKAIFIESNGDTLSKEKIILQPSGKPWPAQETQTYVTEIYSMTDSVYSKFQDPRHKKNSSKRIGKIRESRTGAIETDSVLWTHPFRTNQYVYTELAPFPEVRINKLKVDNEWISGTTFILYGWGKFKGRVSTSYRVTGNKQKKYFNQTLSDCWEIKGTGVHNKLGTSVINFTYHKEYGFLEMNYEFYDGTKIQFVLDEVTIKK